MDDCISRKMAIDAFEPEHDTDWYTPQIIEVLEALPLAQPETHDKRTETHACDSISRQKAIDTVKKMRAVCDTDSIEDYEALLETAFEALPFAQPETEERTAELVQNVSDSDLIFRKAAIDAVTNGMCSGYDCEVIEALEYLPPAQPEIIRCKDCKHRPRFDEDDELEFPTSRCPCQCDDFYYSWMPEDDWFCGDAERRTDG